jgi:2-polyprenyl-3-methyl-5-hydroxy-6-metoxy-1,4-benzoquinol methylase
MGLPSTCRICSGPLRLLHAGSGIEARAESFSPTNHSPGQYGDLFQCRRCGTVEQPSLPHGDALLELYRRMRDEHYLDEERGRRATARRLLDAIGRHAPSGRLLDVGCGHGLLLDEARARGYEVEGLEPSEHARAHAREALGLTVHPLTLAQLAARGGGPGGERGGEPCGESPPPESPPRFAAIVLADVLEHLDDPPAAIDVCAELLEPGGVLCLVTPDPGSRTARVAGASWWGFLPAHTFLLPRRTLRGLLESRGLDVSEDLSLVRSFTLRYWMAGLAERGGGVGRAVTLLRRAVPARASLSLSLGDERVVVARRGARYATVGAGAAASTPAAVVSSAPA